ncbi:dihydrofolate reductase [Microbacterium trichothecenolyticum]|uniref:Dihydrofolate reductase n=1 Tax=Microbacterium trichothecenolyticum TaxID=69370 RepID=A0ABU0TSR3_MICTR|nr:dihydrofolate reductase [Microbacterium trichothecenolyticum]MDQ1122712.1 dihydrofolate reductase [Microbacterium trichothecenolyticum]
MTSVGLVWAQAHDGVIGADGGMPWHVPEDLAHFRAVTGSADVIMGRRTWDSLPPRFRPLPGRRNIVVTRSDEWSAEGAHRAASLDDALAQATGERAWVIGGGQLYAEAIEHADVVQMTRLDVTVDGDTRAPRVDGWSRVASDPAVGWLTSRGGIRYRFETYRRAAR